MLKYIREIRYVATYINHFLIELRPPQLDTGSGVQLTSRILGSHLLQQSQGELPRRAATGRNVDPLCATPCVSMVRYKGCCTAIILYSNAIYINSRIILITAHHNYYIIISIQCRNCMPNPVSRIRPTAPDLHNPT